MVMFTYTSREADPDGDVTFALHKTGTLEERSL